MPTAAGRSATRGGTAGESCARATRQRALRGSRLERERGTHEEKEEEGRRRQARDEEPKGREEVRALVDDEPDERVQLRASHLQHRLGL